MRVAVPRQTAPVRCGRKTASRSIHVAAMRLSSANSAGWPEVTTHQMAIGFQMALNGYGMTMKSWNAR